MRADLDDSIQRKSNLLQLRVGATRRVLTGDITIAADGPVAYFLDCGSAGRNVTLPAISDGKLLMFFNIGAANTITIKTPAGVTLTTLPITSAVQCVSSTSEWSFLTKTQDFLDPTEITSSGGTITVSVVGGTVVNLDVAPAAIDHNALLNFVANKHIDHTAVSIGTAATSGLSGGGDISSTRALVVDLSRLTTDTPVLGDSFAFYDLSGGDTNNATLTTLNSILDHNSLVNFVANKHIDHTSVTIAAGTGLSGGGDISASRTLALDINGLVADTPVGADSIVFYDASGADTNKVTLTNFLANLSIYTAGGTDVAVADGGTGSSTAAGAATNLGLGTGDSPQFTAVNIGHATDTTLARVSAGVASIEGGTIALLNAANIFTAVQGYALSTLTYNATQTWDVSVNPCATLSLTGNITSFSVSGVVAGKTYLLKVTQDTSVRTIAYTAANFKFNGGSAPTLSIGSGAIDYYLFVGVSATLLHEIGRSQAVA